MTTATMRLLAWADGHGGEVRTILDRALTVAGHVHRGRFRRNGDPYIEHPVAVALILADCGADPTTVVAAILHDLGDSTELRVDIGDAVADLVVAFTVLDRSGTVPETGTTDPRVLQIKIADRLHNMRTIHCLEAAKQRSKADQTRRLVAPAARSLGLTALGDELDALATATLHATDPVRSTGRPDVTVRTLSGALSIGTLVLPPACRDRWRQEWDGELHATTDLAERLRFVVDILTRLPTLAVLTRRTEHR